MKKKKLPRYPGWLSAAFLHFPFSPTGPPMGGKSQYMGGLAHFDLGRPLALREIPGPDRNRKNTNSRCKGSRNGGKRLPRYPGWLPATFLHFTFWATNPKGQEIAKYGGLGHFGIGRPLPCLVLSILCSTYTYVHACPHCNT